MFRFLLSLALFVSLPVYAQDFRQVAPNTQPVTSGTPDYTSGDCLGGLLTFDMGSNSNFQQGVIVGATVADAEGQSITGDLIFFDSLPAASTFTDNATCTIADADRSRVIGQIKFVAGDVTTSGGNSYTTSTDDFIPFNAVITSATSRVVYGVFITRTAANLATTSDVTIRLNVYISQ